MFGGCAERFGRQSLTGCLLFLRMSLISPRPALSPMGRGEGWGRVGAAANDIL